MRSSLSRTVSRLACLLNRSRGWTIAGGLTEAAPLDPVERLQRSGSTFPVVLELSRLGW